MDAKPNLNKKECNCDGFRSINYVSNIFIRLKFAFEIFFLDLINFRDASQLTFLPITYYPLPITYYPLPKKYLLPRNYILPKNYLSLPKMLEGGKMPLCLKGLIILFLIVKIYAFFRENESFLK